MSLLAAAHLKNWLFKIHVWKMGRYDFLISTWSWSSWFRKITKTWSPDLHFFSNQEILIFKSWFPDLNLISTWSRPDLERINGQLFSPMNKGRKSSNLMKSIREKIILLQYVHEFLKLLGKRLCLFDMSFYKFAKILFLS